MLSVVLTGCQNPKKIDAYNDKIENADSVTATVEMQIPFVGDTIFTAKKDGSSCRMLC